MGNNRFIQMESFLKDDKLSRFGVRSRRKLVTAKTKDKKCQQFNEEAISENQFVLDVLQFFFEERLEESKLTPELKDIAARALWAATEGSRAMDLVPRPAGGKPGIVWLISQAVQIGFRAAQNRCFYEAVRVTVKASLRSEYEVAKMVTSQSFYADPFSATTKPTAISDSGVELIKRFESYKGNLYNDPAGHCTIGYGTLVHRGKCDGSESKEYKDGISEARATELLRAETASVATTVSNSVTVSLNQNQFDALVSFTYNIGDTAFRNSTLLSKLNGGDYAAVSTEMKKWVKAGGKTMQGLVDRREAEVELFNKPIVSGTKSIYDHLNYTRTATLPKTIVAVDSFTGDNGFLAMKAGKNPGCLRVDSVSDMVTKVINKAGSDKIKKLFLYGHGNKGLIVVGSGQDGSVAGKIINGNQADWEPHLQKLKSKFTNDGEIFLGGCNVGAGQQGADKLKKIADITGVKVIAPTGKVYGDCTEESGSVHQVANPGQPAPAPIESPSDSKKLKLSTSHSMSMADWTNKTPDVRQVYINPKRLALNQLESSLYKAQNMDAVRFFVEGIDNTRVVQLHAPVSGIINAFVYLNIAGHWKEYAVYSDYDYFLEYKNSMSTKDWQSVFEVKWALKEHLKKIIEGRNPFLVA